ncbi:MAG: RNA polymerase Rpb4 family protein [Euryarchaeota archaeon]|nr:RNA polymerase Rpb4 family protein [Euryarchaeota archaeon]MBU4490903.1 RNA polymerase Rpb4 family protein [Euryarchaeota archaeon]MCG2727836.1 RNA polymerase Rpb4 family protein [Candidatus Methanoperedenaceae archaeon]
MIVKQIISEEILTLGEVRNVLDQIKKERETESKELGYELRKAMSHAETFSKLDAKKSRELMNDLLKLEKMKPEIAVRIADILPMSNDEVRSIYAKERYTLSENELKQILELIAKFT